MEFPHEPDPLLQSSLNGPRIPHQPVDGALPANTPEQGHQDQVVVRDLTTLDLPVLDSPLFHALRGAEPANEAIRQAVALSDRLIAELKAVDLLLIGAPCTTSMYRHPSRTGSIWWHGPGDFPLHRHLPHGAGGGSTPWCSAAAAACIRTDDRCGHPTSSPCSA